MNRITAVYDMESPVGLERAAQVVAGEQSTGTFIRLAAETDALRDRSSARVEAIEITGVSEHPSLPCRLAGSRFERGRVTISWPMDTMGPSLTNLMATIAGNLFELAEISAIRLVSLEVPEAFATAHPGPLRGIDGTRALSGVASGPLIGTIIKPSVGLGPEETAALTKTLAEAGIDFIKDDELQANGPACPFEERARAVMRVLNDHADRVGKRVMYAFNVTGEIDEMYRHIDLLEQLGGTCAMVSLNWIGLSGLQAVRKHCGLAVHGHRNGWGLMSRSPDIGIAYPVMQLLWRLGGADHLHVNGLRNKFTEPDEVVSQAAQSVQAPITQSSPHLALPVFSSGQTAWQVGPSIGALGNDDFLFCAGGGIMSHPSGPAAGITSLRQAAEAAKAGIAIQEFAKSHSELAQALETFKGAVSRG